MAVREGIDLARLRLLGLDHRSADARPRRESVAVNPDRELASRVRLGDDHLRTARAPAIGCRSPKDRRSPQAALAAVGAGGGVPVASVGNEVARA